MNYLTRDFSDIDDRTVIGMISAAWSGMTRENMREDWDLGMERIEVYVHELNKRMGLDDLWLESDLGRTVNTRTVESYVANEYMLCTMITDDIMVMWSVEGDCVIAEYRRMFSQH